MLAVDRQTFCPGPFQRPEGRPGRFRIRPHFDGGSRPDRDAAGLFEKAFSPAPARKSLTWAFRS